MMETLTIVQLLTLLRKRIAIIIVITTLAAVVALLASIYFIAPRFEAQTQLLINQQTDDEERLWYQMETDLQLIRTYNIMMTSSTILQYVITELQLTKSPEQLAKQIQVEHENDSKVIQITVTAESEKEAVHIANTLANVVQQQIPKLMNVNNIHVLSRATIGDHTTPVSPNIYMNTAIGIAIGLFFSICFVYVVEMLDRSIRNEVELEQLLAVPVLGVVNFTQRS